MGDNPLTPLTAGSVGLVRRLFGPASSELGEMLADRVRAYRALNLKRIMEKVEAKIGDSDVLEMPLRLSIPFIEKASLEDNSVLAEMWANLLVDASKGVDERHHLFLDILGSLTPNSVAFLEFIVGDFYKEEDWYSSISWKDDWLHDLEDFVNNEICPSLYEDGWKEDFKDDLFEKLLEFQHPKPFWLFRVDLPLIMNDVVSAVDSGKSLEDYGAVILPRSAENPAMQILERENLLERHDGSFKLPYCPFEFSYVVATPLAVELVEVCRGQAERE